MEHEKQSASCCGDCGVKEGQLHVLGCDQERCPCCGCQMISCACRHEWKAAQQGVAVAKIERRLSKKDSAAFLEFINKNGRIPFTVDRPAALQSDDRAGPRRALLELLEKSLCGRKFPCPNPDIVDYEKVRIAGFGEFSVRSYPGYVGRKPDTGEQVEVPATLIVGFRADSTLAKLEKQMEASKAEQSEPGAMADLLKACEEVLVQLRHGEKQVELPGIGLARAFDKNFARPPVVNVKFSLFKDFTDELNNRWRGHAATAGFG